MAALPIVDHDRKEASHQPPGLGLIGALALPGSILTAAYEQGEAGRGFTTSCTPKPPSS
jgi:hypothetical protein